MEDKEKLLKALKIEDFVWVIYLVIIGLSFYSNHIERDYIINDNENSKNKYQLINIIIFSIAVLIYLYFAYDNYKQVKDLNENDSCDKIKYSYLELIGALFALISGLIFLYVAIEDRDLETEIAFN